MYANLTAALPARFTPAGRSGALMVRRLGTCAAAILLSSMPFEAQRAGTVQQLPVALQPLAQQVRRVDTALTYLGQPLSAGDRRAIDEAIGDADEQEAAARLQ